MGVTDMGVTDMGVNRVVEGNSANLRGVKRIHSTTWATGIIASAGLTACAAVMEPCMSLDCWRCYQDRVENCNDSYPDDDTTPLFQAANQACNDAADTALVACENDVGWGDIYEEWKDFQAELDDCMALDSGPQGIQNCIAQALRRFREAIDDLEDDDDDDDAACRDAALAPASGSPTYLLEMARTYQGPRSHHALMPIDVGALLTFQAGVGPGRDVSLAPCATKVMLRASYHTKDGIEQRIVDMDLDMSDGVTLNYYPEPDRLVHADFISLIAVFMDDDWHPVFFETALLDIEHSHATADFNRDGSVDAQDMLDFVESHQHGTRRSDLNKDGQHTSDDLAVFVTEHTAGT